MNRATSAWLIGERAVLKCAAASASASAVPSIIAVRRLFGGGVLNSSAKSRALGSTVGSGIKALVIAVRNCVHSSSYKHGSTLFKMSSTDLTKTPPLDFKLDRVVVGSCVVVGLLVDCGLGAMSLSTVALVVVVADGVRLLLDIRVLLDVREVLLILLDVRDVRLVDSTTFKC